MTAVIIPFPSRLRRPKPGCDPYFGLCPECGGNDGYLNIGPNHWFICDEHNVAWCAGSNLFSGWQDESEEEHEFNRDKIAELRIVEPWYPPRGAA